MKQIEQLSNGAKNSIRFLAAEFKFAKELGENLKKVTDDAVHVDQNIREANKMVHVYKWLAKAERKVARNEDHMLSLLKELQTIATAKYRNKEKDALVFRSFSQQLKVADDTLKKLASFYTGKIGLELSDIEAEEKLLQGLTKKKKDAAAESLKNRLEKEINDLQQDISKLLLWIKANVTVVQSIEKWAADFESKSK